MIRTRKRDGLRSPTILEALAITTAISGCGGLVQSSSTAPDDSAPPVVASPPSTGAPAQPGPAQTSAPVPKPPNPVERCTFSEGPWLIDDSTSPPPEILVRWVKSQPLLYVKKGRRFDRYTVASGTACVLQRDGDFAPSLPAGDSQVAVDDAGNIWSSSTDQLQRAFPLPVLKCTTGPGYRDGTDALFYVGSLLLDDDGTGGWGLEGPAGRLGRLTLGPDACSVDLTDSPWGSLAVRASTPRDTQGRLHVVDAPAPGAIGIYTGDGTFVTSYSGKSAPTDPAPRAATRCSGGICVLTAPDSAGHPSIVYLDENGNPRGPAVALYRGLGATTVAATREGAVFVAGDTDPTLEPLHEVVIQLAPAPPP